MSKQGVVKNPIQKLRTAKQSVCFAITESLQVVEVFKKIKQIFDEYVKDNIIKVENRKQPKVTEQIILTGQELKIIKSALRDYITLRMANVFDPHPGALSVRNFKVNLKKINSIPEVTKIVSARNNWIGHINQRFIGPVDDADLTNEKIINILGTLLMLISTGVLEKENK